MKSHTSLTWLVSLFAFVAAADPLSAQYAAPRSVEPVIELSPFVVNSSRDTGYQAMTTLAGTRLDTPLKDLGAAISIYTKDFLDDIGATNSSEFLLYATSMEAAGPGGNFSGSALTGSDFNSPNPPAPDGDRGNPQGASRSRGLSAPTFTRDFYATRIAIDSYNTERITVLRGPNAALFGVSSPAGVTDTMLVRADLQRNKNKVTMRLDNNFGLRNTVDFNRVLIPDKLAVRIAGLQGREEYNQRPAYERKERLYGTLTYQPFKATSLRVNFETGRTRANRPYPFLPGNGIANEWYLAGRPGFDWTFYDDPARNPFAANQVSNSFLPYYMGTIPAAGVGITLFYDNPDDQRLSRAVRVNTPTTGAAVADAVRTQLFHPLLNRDLANDNLGFYVTRNIFELPAAAYWSGGNVLPGQLSGLVPPGLKPQSFTDFSAFDWRNKLLDETGVFNDSFHGSNFVFEQRAWDNRLGIELAFDQQRMDKRNRWSWMSGINQGIVRIDTTVTLPTGQPNPNVGRPYFTNNQSYTLSDSFDKVETRRATGYVKYDFKDLDASWGKWLGSHTLSGLVERFSTNFASYLVALAAEGAAARSMQPLVQSRRVGLVTYVGPSLIGNNNPLQLNSIKVPHVGPGPTVDLTHFARAANDTDPGAFRTSPLSLVQTINNGQVTREVIESRAATLQSYWLQDHLITVLGWRRDEDFFALRSPAFVTNPNDLNDPGKVIWGLDDLSFFPNKPPFRLGKEVKSYSAVLRWPQKWIKLPRGMDFSVFWNKSENFTPVAGRVNSWGVPLPSPEGTTEEYGFNFSAFNDKLTLRVNRFENTSLHTVFVGSSFTPIINFALDAVLRWSVEGNVNPHLVAMRNADIEKIKAALPVPNYLQLYNVTVTGTPPNLVATRNSNIPGASDPGDATATGEELDIIYNPTPNWRILANLAHQETVRGNFIPNSKQLLALLMPVVQELSGRANSTYPTGWQIGDPLPANVETFGQFIDRTVLLPYAQDLAIEGDPTAEQRNWRFNLVTNYSFGSGSIFGEKLKGWSIGGGLRWQSKMVVGYPSSRLANGAVVFDKSKPWHAPAETNVDAFVSYGRKIWGNRIDWKAQLNVTNLYTPRELIPMALQPWGEPSHMRLAPEQRWYLANTFSF